MQVLFHSDSVYTYVGVKRIYTIYIPTLEQRRENPTYNFSKKCVSNPRTRNMFAQPENKHTMQLRKTNKFTETRTNTQ